MGNRQIAGAAKKLDQGDSVRISVRYFALLREQAGRESETIETGDISGRALYRQLVSKYKFSLDSNRVRLAINDAFSDWDTALKDGDVIVFVPPVAGG